MDIPKCKLCMINDATQNNSHILSKFLKKEYLKSHTDFFLFNTITKRTKKEQDLPKENKIFCPRCETRFQTIESPVSLHLKNSYNIFKRKDYPKFNFFDFEYQNLNRCNPKLFALFVYSLIWRAHISNLDIFKAFILPENCAEDLRKILNISLPDKIGELDTKLNLIKNQQWEYIFIKPEKRSNLYNNINYNNNIDKNKLAFLFIIEYAIIFFLDKNKIPRFSKNYLNQDFKTPKIMILDNKSWNDTTLRTTIMTIK